MFLQKNAGLGQQGDRKFITFLVACWVCCRFVIAKMMHLKKTMGLKPVEEVRQGKPKVAVVRSKQFIGATYSLLKGLCCVNCVNDCWNGLELTNS